MDELTSHLTSALNIHLNLNQSYQITSPSLMHLAHKLPIDSLANVTLFDHQIRFPSSSLNVTSPSATIRVRLLFLRHLIRRERDGLLFSWAWKHWHRLVKMTCRCRQICLVRSRCHSWTRMAVRWRYERREMTPSLSSSLMIPPSPSHPCPSTMSRSSRMWFNAHFIGLNRQLHQSVHFEVQPIDANLSYLFLYRFDHSYLIFNSSHQLIDGHTFLCASRKLSQMMMTNVRDDIRRCRKRQYAAILPDNEQTANHHSLTFALRELNETEADHYCQHPSSPPRVDEEREFTSNYRLRLYHSGCHYFDENRRWRSDGMRVSDDLLLLYHLGMIRWDHWLITLGHNAWRNT